MDIEWRLYAPDNLKVLEQFPGLYRMKARISPLVKNLDGLAACVQLCFLVLKADGISGPELTPLAQLVCLVDLVLDLYSATTLQLLAACTGLTALAVRNAPKLSTVSPLGQLVKLRKLELYNLPKVAAIQQVVLRMKGLERLALVGLSDVRQTGDAWMLKLPALRYLEVGVGQPALMAPRVITEIMLRQGTIKEVENA